MPGPVATCVLSGAWGTVGRSHLVELSLDKKVLIQKLEGGKIRKLSILTGFSPGVFYGRLVVNRHLGMLLFF